MNSVILPGMNAAKRRAHQHIAPQQGVGAKAVAQKIHRAVEPFLFLPELYVLRKAELLRCIRGGERTAAQPQPPEGKGGGKTGEKQAPG